MRTKSSSGRNRSAQRRLLRRVPIGLLLGLGAGLALVAACGNDESPGPTGTPTATGTGTGTGTVERCDPGDTEQCWEELGQNGNVLSCLEGQRTCVDGQWGPCDPESVFTRDAPARPMAFSDAGPCGNPCDPGCQSWSEDPDGATSSNPTTVTLHGADIRSAIPGGHVAKFLKEPCAQQCDCQADHSCNTTSGMCELNATGYTDPGCPAQADYTTTVPCGSVIPVCNRGAVDTGVQTIVGYIQPGNCLQAQDPFCTCSGFGCNNPDVRCEMTANIPAGQCVFFTEADCTDVKKGTPITAWPGGENSFVINSQDFAGEFLPECRCDNNWTPLKDPDQACPTVDQYAQVTQEIVYEGMCGLGQYVQWGYFRYLADTPSNASGDTSVIIEAHTADTVAGLTVDCSDCVTLATVDSTHPDDCPFTGGPAQCPINLWVELGGLPAGQQSVLELVVTLVPAPDAQEGPDLLDWDITYSCVDSE